jgi:hypothetical protein
LRKIMTLNKLTLNELSLKSCMVKPAQFQRSNQLINRLCKFRCYKGNLRKDIEAREQLLNLNKSDC